MKEVFDRKAEIVAVLGAGIGIDGEPSKQTTLNAERAAEIIDATPEVCEVFTLGKGPKDSDYPITEAHSMHETLSINSKRVRDGLPVTEEGESTDTFQNIANLLGKFSCYKSDFNGNVLLVGAHAKRAALIGNLACDSTMFIADDNPEVKIGTVIKIKEMVLRGLVRACFKGTHSKPLSPIGRIEVASDLYNFPVKKLKNLVLKITGEQNRYGSEVK